MVSNKYNTDLYVNELFYIPLSSNPTTGYAWKLTEYPSFIRIIDDKYYPASHPPGILGAGGTQVFTLIADYAGEGLLHFDYATPWGDHGGYRNIYVIARESNPLKKNYENLSQKRSDISNLKADNIDCMRL